MNYHPCEMLQQSQESASPLCISEHSSVVIKSGLYLYVMPSNFVKVYYHSKVVVSGPLDYCLGYFQPRMNLLAFLIRSTCPSRTALGARLMGWSTGIPRTRRPSRSALRIWHRYSVWSSTRIDKVNEDRY
jgi:hypothetical protein